MNRKPLLLAILLILSVFQFCTLESQAKRKGFVRIKAAFKAKQSVPSPTYSEDEENNTADLTLGGRKKFTTASILIKFNDLLDQIARGANFSTATTGTTNTAGAVRLNILASKFKEDGGFEFSTFQDDESTVEDASVKILKVSKKGVITLKVKATFNNVKRATLDENGNEVLVERVDGIKAFGRVKYNSADAL